MKRPYTDKQGQYLAFIYYYGKIHAHGLIERTPGQARSIRLLIPRDELPDLI
jgi:hypothetical protein